MVGRIDDELLFIASMLLSVHNKNKLKQLS